MQGPEVGLIVSPDVSSYSELSGETRQRSCSRTSTVSTILYDFVPEDGDYLFSESFRCMGFMFGNEEKTDTERDEIDILFEKMGFDFMENELFTAEMETYFASPEYLSRKDFNIQCFVKVSGFWSEDFLMSSEAHIGIPDIDCGRFKQMIKYYSNILIDDQVNFRNIDTERARVFTTKVFKEFHIEFFYYLTKALYYGVMPNPLIISAFINTSKAIFDQEPALTELNLKSPDYNFSISTSHCAPEDLIRNQAYKKVSIPSLRRRVATINSHSPYVEKLTIVGDLHGKFIDLVKVFLENGVVSGSHAYLINGDIVDRHPQSLELLLFTLGLKILYPNRLYINRGNHEFESISSKYGFKAELRSKLNSTLCSNTADTVHYQFCQLFDKLPIAALVDNEIFVVHGGIPVDIDVTINDIKHVSHYLHELPSTLCDRNTNIMRELLWNDPYTSPPLENTKQINHSKVKEAVSENNTDCGLKRSRAMSRRGTQKAQHEELVISNYIAGSFEASPRGSYIYRFGEALSELFCYRNGIKLIIRSHEHVPGGLSLVHSGKVMTVFSCSDYCGSGSEAAVLNYSRFHSRVGQSMYDIKDATKIEALHYTKDYHFEYNSLTKG